MEIILDVLVLVGSIVLKKFIKAVIANLWSGLLEAYYRTLGHEVATVLANILAGVILGGISLILIPSHITPTLEIRIANLIVTPLIVGALLNLSANIKFYKPLLRFDHLNFFSGYTFTLTWAGMRFIFAN